MNLTTPNKKKHVLSFVTLTGDIRYYAGTSGELENGEQTRHLARAVKFDTSKEAINADKKLDARYYRQTITELAPDFWA